MDSFRYGRILHAGLTLAIVGPPNAGKSSLFNRLLDRDRSIVTATPGTTRDLVSERLAIAGIPVELIDTAGLRATEDEAESLGIAKSHEALAAADLILIVSEATRPLTPEENKLIADLDGRPYLLVRNKADLVQHPMPVVVAAGTLTLMTSALTGEGIEDLRQQITGILRGGAVTESGLVTNLRQHTALVSSLSSHAEARTALQQGIPHEMFLLNLYASLQSLDELTGTTTPDDVLNLIFSTFCIGK